jgi:hypothetical protein
MVLPNKRLTPGDLLPAVRRVFEVSAGNITDIERTWRPESGAPVFTMNGRYQARGWTEWTQGFQFGSSLLQFDATDDRAFLELGRSRTVEPHGAASDAHGRARSRLQQRLDLRHALAPHA